ncbi:MAG TPA: FAD-dependent oxidoreductase [Solirubrobacteraceae bacterium]|jgi:sulfide:quinone oxidoreductase|nr:FAD-dependent oxidoreductase [Solirubrobacteraceae bacterium]
MPRNPSSAPTTSSRSDKLNVVIAGGGVAALETALALADLAPDRTEVTVIAPNSEFVYRPMVVREPFAYGAAHRYPLESIVHDAGATLLCGELGWIDPATRTIHTKADEAIEYDALVLALGATVTKRYPHALTIDDRDLAQTMHGLIQDVEGGYVNKLAFVAPGRMAWPLPLYELALMTAGRAYDMGIELRTTIVTPEDSPLAIFGSSASSTVAELLARANVETINSAYAEVPSSREVVINPGDQRLEVDRVIALPELYGPAVRGIPLGENGFIRVDTHCRVPDVERIYAAGDATDFPIKQGGIGSQQADAAAQSIAALAGAPVTPERFDPTIQGILLTNGKPRYLTAQITGGHGFSSEITDTPTSPPPSKIAAKYLAPYLAEQDN